MFKIQNQCKVLSVNKIKKSMSGFSQLDTLFATSCRCLCTHFGHMANIKAWNIIEHNNRLRDHWGHLFKLIKRVFVTRPQH